MSARRPETHTKITLDASAMDDWRRVSSGTHSEPHTLLGAHCVNHAERIGAVIRVFHPEADSAAVVMEDGESVLLDPVADGGLFASFLDGATLPLRYRVRFHFPDGGTWEHADPYRFLPSLGDVDLHLFNEGTHLRLWECLGAHPRKMDGVYGVAFAVWAPGAVRVSVVGDFCRWDGRVLPMRQMGSSGVFELFVPGVESDALYKFEIRTPTGDLRLKTDPFAMSMENPPSTASRVTQSQYEWCDGNWLEERGQRDPLRSPVAIYEVHLGSWRRVPEEGNRALTYRELAPLLIEHVKQFHFTHVQLMPVAEHPFGGSWGYQVSGYYAPTARYGTPDDFRYFVDYCHQHGVGVLLDWVPAHFPKDDFALRRFDGTALYEHEDPRRGEHPDWGTLIFNYGRAEVRNFLIANALYWLEEFHIDGLRVDAVASMLYLDYSRKAGEWLPNQYGGKENIEAIGFLQAVNEAVRQQHPGCIMIAEESTGWSGVTSAVSDHGLGFTFKWNMGWMHDTLSYFSKDPVHRKHHQNDLTFAMLYEHSERFVNPLSHDEVVHGKHSLLRKMPGDEWQQFANLRALLAYQYTRPGKKLLFMGAELAQHDEWDCDKSIDWHLADHPLRQGLSRFLADLGRLYVERPSLWRGDAGSDGFSWIGCDDQAQSVFSYLRSDGNDRMIVVMNLTPVPRDAYRIGAQGAEGYRQVLSSDDPKYGGSGYPTVEAPVLADVAMHGYEQSIELRLPPLAVLVLSPKS